MHPLSVALAVTVSGLVAALAALGITRPAPEQPRRPRGYRPAHRNLDPFDGMPVVLLAVAGAVAAGTVLAAVAAGPTGRLAAVLSDVLALILGGIR